MIYRAGTQAVEHREHMRGGSGTVELLRLVGELPKRARLFSVIRLTPGTSIGYHTHEGETEMFYFVSGRGVATDDAERIEVRAGDAMSTPSGHGHAVENTSPDEDLVLVAAIVLD